MSNDSVNDKTIAYRGVTRKTGTRKYEAQLWDSHCLEDGHTRKGKQGVFDEEGKVARAYDLAALKYWGPSTPTNFSIKSYEEELKEMQEMSEEESIKFIRKRSSGFCRSGSGYRGVSRHHSDGRWQARIGMDDKQLYLGTFSNREEAAEAYDIAVIRYKAQDSVTNFDRGLYEMGAIMNNTLPLGRK